ncbi:MAG: serine/threonine-protein kinase PknD [Parachlamydiaceae bacterium]|nr:serine/threonine-protein kinase PknD [Parachlamydiaceae bacterium]
MNKEITCPSCHTHFVLASPPDDLIVSFCPFCQKSLSLPNQSTLPISDQKDIAEKQTTPLISFLPEHLPAQENIQFSIGPYQILQSIGKGGMGEVFLAYDTTCGRRIALKKIRPDLSEHKQLYNRFVKEARITSQLTHPAIIPIYAIHTDEANSYYTMPYIEGNTLKQLLRTARKQERKGEKLDHLAESIPALIRIFLSICQAVAYAHSKKVLHRDLKPENIIIGQYGQIVILDWGLAKLIKSAKNSSGLDSDNEEAEDEASDIHQLTHVGKVVGTIAYMAPERALGQAANIQTDIYSLGVILYQLLTLKSPFNRGSLKEFRLNAHKERLIDPSEISPYRDVPRSLSRVVMKCLAPQSEQRYHTVDELVHDLENYIEGRSEWFQIAELNYLNKSDWEFQENVLIAEHVAITRETEVADWVNLMISKASFQENIKIEANINIGPQGHGIGFLLSIPEAAEREHINDGYCLWIGEEKSKSTKLLRSTVEVINATDVFLKSNEWYQVRIEKIDNNIYFYLNNLLQFSYISHLPLVGTHIGLLARDANFILKDFFVYIGSQNVTVNCLAVPDAFLAHKDYNTALSEYRRIGYSFPGRAEGREAMFRAGITLLEQANSQLIKDERNTLLDLAHDEFGKLYGTPGAPLEYLGKALIYQTQSDFEDEVKCFELAYRRYPAHPLLPVLQEQIIYRMHGSSRYHRQATFNFVLLALRYLPNITTMRNTQKLLSSLKKHCEPLFFIESVTKIEESKELQNINFGLNLAFWLARPHTMIEMINDLIKINPLPLNILGNSVFCLIELGSWIAAEDALEYIAKQTNADAFKIHSDLLKIAIKSRTVSLESAVSDFIQISEIALSQLHERTLFYLLEYALDTQQTHLVHLIYHYQKWQLSSEGQVRLQYFEIWGLLIDKNWKEAGDLLHQYSIETLSQDTTILHFLYGCWLYVTEGKDIANIHFAGIFEVPYPRTWTISSYYFTGKITEGQGWFQKAFLWEKRQLFRQLTLFYHCSGDEMMSLHFKHLAERETIQSPTK